MYGKCGGKKVTRNKTFLIFSGIFLLLFVIVSFMTFSTQGMLMDENVSFWAEQNDSALVKTLMMYASFIGSSEVILLATVIIGIVMLFKRLWRQLFLFFTVSVGGVLLNLAVKQIVQRARPGDEAKYIDVFNFQLEIQSYSFPSGHTMRATILFLVLIYLSYYFMKNTSLKWIFYVICLVLIFAVALSRIMLDAHFATDIAGALVMSVAWFFLCLYFFHRPKDAGFSFYLHR
jgi:undecaprenyl-diphosphatase